VSLCDNDEQRKEFSTVHEGMKQIAILLKDSLETGISTAKDKAIEAIKKDADDKKNRRGAFLLFSKTFLSREKSNPDNPNYFNDRPLSARDRSITSDNLVGETDFYKKRFGHFWKILNT